MGILKDKKSKIKCAKRDNLSVAVFYSVPYSMTEFEDRLHAFCNDFVVQIFDSFNRYEEDCADWNDSNIHQMPLYVLSIQSKTVFVKLYNAFNRKNFCLTFKQCNKKKNKKMNQSKRSRQPPETEKIRQ